LRRKKKKNGEGRTGLPRLSNRDGEARQKKLEADAQAEFDLAWRVDLTIEECTPIVWLAETRPGYRDQTSVMVEDVREDGRDFHVKPLCNHEVLLHAQIDVVEWQAAESASAAVMSVVNTRMGFGSSYTLPLDLGRSPQLLSRRRSKESHSRRNPSWWSCC